MQHVFYLMLRRMRAPIIIIISVYAISTLGFVLIPGIDDQGNPWQMDFFHAFYFVSFMGSTIGFGELPYPFTVSQRFWAVFTIYATVISWLYSIGKIFSLFQDPTFNRMVKRNSFARQVERLQRPFYLVCGFGVTGSRVMQMLQASGIQTVVIDNDQHAIDELEAGETNQITPALCADAKDPDILNIAGIQDKNCIGVLALTNDDHCNLSISIDAKLVSPERTVVSRTQSKETSANLASFGTDYIIDPFDDFADHLVLALTEPYKHIIHDLVFNPRHKVLASPYQNTQGRWVICGYGRFGTALEKRFREHGIPITFIEPNPHIANAPEGTVRGVGTEANTLLQADIESAVGIVAGTPDDADNLSIIITARNLNPKLITVARQNLGANKPVFRAADVNMIMESGRIIANEIFVLIKTPLLTEFLTHVKANEGSWSRALLMDISQLIQDKYMETWAYRIEEESCPAVYYSLMYHRAVKLEFLYRHPRNRDRRLPAMALLLKRGDETIVLPGRHVRLRPDDQVLFCGQRQGHTHMHWIMNNYNVLRYIRTGIEAPGGIFWRWLYQLRKKRRAPKALNKQPDSKKSLIDVE